MKKYFIRSIIMCAAAVVLAASCSYRVARNPFFDEESEPAMPCIVSSDTTLVIVRDFFPKIGKVESLTCDDYSVVPLSKTCMDTVLVAVRPGSRYISTLNVTSGGERGVIVLKQEKQRSAGTPIVSAVGSGMGGREFTVEVKNTPASYLILWQNTLLDRNCLSYRKDGVFTIHVPFNAMEMERSYIRIYSHNAAGAGSEVIVPVQRGRVMLPESKKWS